ncbi:MAG TPA: hypothetical protein PLS23_03975, partial [Phycisphaerae bacterium]|nr:hypothetical protein [Phycisphaerae bacterium]
DNDFFDGGYFPAPLLGPSVVGCGPGIGVYGCGDVFFPDFGYYDDPVFGDWSWGYGDWGWGYGDFYGGFPGVW